MFQAFQYGKNWPGFFFQGYILEKRKVKKRIYVSQLPASISLQPLQRRTWLILFLIASSLISDSSVFCFWNFSCLLEVVERVLLDYPGFCFISWLYFTVTFTDPHFYLTNSFFQLFLPSNRLTRLKHLEVKNPSKTRIIYRMYFTYWLVHMQPHSSVWYCSLTSVNLLW